LHLLYNVMIHDRKVKQKIGEDRLIWHYEY
jgi:hypothetical protein